MDIYNPIGRWRSRTTVTLALTASAVGLGNIWRFSSLASDNGGAPFVIAYLVCLFVIAVPILVAEVALGTHGRSSPVEAVRFAADRSLISRHWQWGAVLGCITGLLILGYQAVVAGWSIYYATHMKAGALTIPSPDMAAGFFADLVASPGQMILYQSLFFVIVGSPCRR
jgi:NSS family neurotransmitter:Na+ symporter